MPTLDALNQQLNTANANLASYISARTEQEKILNNIKAGLLDYTAVGEEGYFKKTGAQKLVTKEVPRYTDVYNKEFSAIKDIQFTFGSDATTSSKTDTAFYVFNPEKTAAQKTEQQISDVEKYNLAVEKQKEDIAQFLAGEKQIAQQNVLQKYLSTVLSPPPTSSGFFGKDQSNPFEYDQVDLNTPSGLARWNKANRSSRQVTYAYDLRGKKTKPIYSVKLSAAESAEKKKLTTAIETTRFMSSPTLQKTYAELYQKDLEKSISDIAKNQTKVSNQIKKIQEKIARQ
jgi:hypothetical protein